MEKYRHRAAKLREIQQSIETELSIVPDEHRKLDDAPLATEEIQAMFPVQAEYVNAETRALRRSLNGGTGRPIDFRARALRPYVQALNDSRGRTAS